MQPLKPKSVCVRINTESEAFFKPPSNRQEKVTVRMPPAKPAAVVGALTTAPKFPFSISIEPDLSSVHDDSPPGPGDEQVLESERVVNGFGIFDSIIDSAVNVVAGVAIGGIGKLPIGIISPMDVDQIINVGRGGGLFPVLTPQQVAKLGINSDLFYCVVGSAVPAQAPPVQQTAASAVKVNKDFPSLWFVNFPKKMAAQDVAMVRQYRQNMTDFRSWSSQKWWEEVARRDGTPNDVMQRARQSKIFAQMAVEDMLKMSW